MFTFSVFGRKKRFLGKFGLKIQNYQFKLKFGWYQDWFEYAEFSGGVHSLFNFNWICQNCQFKLKFGTYNHLQNIWDKF